MDPSGHWIETSPPDGERFLNAPRRRLVVAVLLGALLGVLPLSLIGLGPFAIRLREQQHRLEVQHKLKERALDGEAVFHWTLPGSAEVTDQLMSLK